jgi:hypothetical protein
VANRLPFAIKVKLADAERHSSSGSLVFGCRAVRGSLSLVQVDVTPSVPTPVAHMNRSWVLADEMGVRTKHVVEEEPVQRADKVPRPDDSTYRLTDAMDLIDSHVRVGSDGDANVSGLDGTCQAQTHRSGLAGARSGQQGEIAVVHHGCTLLLSQIAESCEQSVDGKGRFGHGVRHAKRIASAM